MNFFEQSFGNQDPYQQTAQFFKPEADKPKQQNVKKRRENSLPQQHLAAIKSILQSTKLLQKNALSRKTTMYSIQDSNKENICNYQSTQQIKKKSAKDISNLSNNDLDQNFKKSQNSLLQQQYESCKTIKKSNPLQCNSQGFNQLQSNQKFYTTSNSHEKRHIIKVKDPYRIFSQPQISVSKKDSSKSFVNYKAQNKLVERIFSSRSDSFQI
ncbi:unnamed protein product (macronuclear) [Paramecium tetraurelia]|uniref:Uncharacterized protein n=1 Tax=Paramecium tetraurelia TaxID=5888 RepID=A0D665_PARTE|nr:uncharacterized protein GSPATT00013962001 [Paramecium tetraurelia]CAK78532.1 unnamed protein product [Paramecium tetraurelia]|eukprot:XP_001445929.1 hypothetical protein (macronuclear) [Paramecium tetraurelia strain d4-2]